MSKDELDDHEKRENNKAKSMNLAKAITDELDTGVENAILQEGREQLISKLNIIRETRLNMSKFIDEIKELRDYFRENCYLENFLDEHFNCVEASVSSLIVQILLQEGIWERAKKNIQNRHDI